MTDTDDPRRHVPSVWCSRFVSVGHPPGGVDVPGYRGGGEAELCEACERDRLAALVNEQRDKPNGEGEGA